jgi:hypothetical protein
MMRLKKRGFLLPGLAVLVYSLALTTEDPGGAIYPGISVVRESFVVRYWHARENRAYRIIIHPDRQYVSPPRALPEVSYGDFVRFDDFRLVADSLEVYVPRSHRWDEPFSFLVSDGVSQEQHTVGGLSKSVTVWGAALLGSELILAVTDRPSDARPNNLQLVRIRLADGSVVARTVVGDVTPIGAVQTVSSLVLADGTIAVAWVKKDGTLLDTPCRTGTLLISRWDVDTRELKTEVLVHGVWYRPHPALAFSRGQFLVAYHQGSGQYCMEDSTIELAWFPRVAP